MTDKDTGKLLSGIEKIKTWQKKRNEEKMCNFYTLKITRYENTIARINNTNQVKWSYELDKSYEIGARSQVGVRRQELGGRSKKRLNKKQNKKAQHILKLKIRPKQNSEEQVENEIQKKKIDSEEQDKIQKNKIVTEEQDSNRRTR